MKGETMARWKFFGARAQGSVRIAAYASLVDGDNIVIGDKTYEFRAAGPVSITGAVLVIVVTSNAVTLANFVAAVNANKPTVPVSAAVDATDTAVARLIADGRGAAGNLTFTASLTGATNQIDGSGLLYGGENGGNELLHRGKYTVTALDILATGALIETALPNGVEFFQCEVRASTGAPKAVSDTFVAVDTKIKVTLAGSTHLVAGDVVEWLATE